MIEHCCCPRFFEVTSFVPVNFNVMLGCNIMFWFDFWPYIKVCNQHYCCPIYFEVTSFAPLSFDVMLWFDFSSHTKVQHCCCPTFVEVTIFSHLSFDVMFWSNFPLGTKVCNPTLLLPHIFRNDKFCSNPPMKPLKKPPKSHP